MNNTTKGKLKATSTKVFAPFSREKHRLNFSTRIPQASIWEDIKGARQDLINGLLSVQTEAGWGDPTGELSQVLWTTVEVCKSLLCSDVPITGLDNILNKIDLSRVQIDDLCGWESEHLPGAISTYVTSDTGLLLLVLGMKKDLGVVLDSLKKMQNTNGGWGVCNGDTVSKTRSTSFVLRLYASCLVSPWAYSFLDIDSFRLGIRWLGEASNDTDGGWGNLADTPPSNVSATAIALDVILSTKLALTQHPNINIPVRDSMIRSGLSFLIDSGKEGQWRGPVEEFGIQIPGSPKRRHAAAGMGTIVVAQVLSICARLGYISPQDSYLLKAIRDIIIRCKPYSTNHGKWIVPSDQGGSPSSWNSAFALDALNQFEKTYIDYLQNGFVEAKILEGPLRQKTRWQQISLMLGILITLIVVVPRLDFLSGLVNWFNSQSALMQGILMVFVTLVIERLVQIAGAITKSVSMGTIHRSEQAGSSEETNA